MPIHQSAYGRNHSTETVLLKVFSDLQMTKDRGQVPALLWWISRLLLTQYSGATYFWNLWQHALAWFESYLSGRTYCVVVDG